VSYQQYSQVIFVGVPGVTVKTLWQKNIKNYYHFEEGILDVLFHN
jgi:Iap family predicted aminopeptidase